MINVRKASDNMPAWQREKRAPTRKELAEKHFADRGGMDPGPGNSLPADEPAGEMELAELPGLPGTFVRKPKQDSEIKMRKIEL